MTAIHQRKWFERSFALGLPLDHFPELLERLRGTPLRLRERMEQLGSDRARRPDSGAWSGLEHAGHLVDLESLWLGRVEDLAGGLGQLRAADLENRATWEAGHNDADPDALVREFSTRRNELIHRLQSMDAAAVRASATHPRLGQPMSTVDLCFFVAEHDDHHLATITALKAKFEATDG